jgi:Xaa-Pro aminopeptidase
MNKLLREKVIHPISTEELERRWAAVRDVMGERRIDFLIVQNTNDYLGGYIKWLNDEPVMHNYPGTVIFPVSDEMTTIYHGSSDPDSTTPPAWALRGVRKRLSVPVMTSLNYAAALDAEVVVEELKAYRGARICLVNEPGMTAGFVKTVRSKLSSVEFVDITDEIDLIKAIKSPEEIERIKVNAEVHDKALEACFAAIQPGVREFEVAAAGRNAAMLLGSEQHIAFVGSSPLGTPVPFNSPHAMNRMLQEGDQVNILLEVNDASGYYTHLSRLAVIGEVSDELQEVHEIALEAQKFSLDLVKPGADPVEILKANNEFLAERNMPIETRIYAHGQGYDMVERPSFQAGETMKIAENMNIAVHPTARNDRAMSLLTDNYIVNKNGVGECIHKTPKKIFAL